MMSYLGFIGQIMSWSGLAELWEQVYAKGSVAHMLSDCLNQTDRDHLASMYKEIIDQNVDFTGKQEDETVGQFYQVVSNFHITLSKLLVRAELESYGYNIYIRSSSC